MRLNDLRAFVRVADTRSITGAAQALCAPKSSISRSVARLESDLDVALFERSTHSLRLTEAGRLLLPYANRIIVEVSEAETAIADVVGTPTGPLRVSVPLGFGYSLLGPMVPGFAAAYPDVQILIDVENHSLDMLAQEIDVVSRFGPLPDSLLIARHLAALPLCLCASHSYIERRGIPQTPDDLNKHDLVSAVGISHRWPFLAENGERRIIDVKPRLLASDTAVSAAMLVNGGGIGWLPLFLVMPAIERGELMQIFPGQATDILDVYALYPSHKGLSVKARAFINALLDHLTRINADFSRD